MYRCIHTRIKYKLIIFIKKKVSDLKSRITEVVCIVVCFIEILMHGL